MAEACYLCSFLWTSVVVLHIAQRVTRAKVGVLQTALEHTICWGLPILFLILSFALPGFWESPTEAEDWCRLNPLAEVIFWFVPLSVCIMFDFGITGRPPLTTGFILHRIRKDLKQIEKIQIVTESVRRRAGGKLRAKLLSYLVAFLICWLPGTATLTAGLVARIWAWADPNCTAIWLFYLQRTTYPLQGFLNFFVYSLDSLPCYRRANNQYTALAREETNDTSWLFSSRRRSKRSGF